MPKEAKNKENKVKKTKTAKEKKHFFKDTKTELKKVIWPTSKQLVNNTLAVIAVVLLVGVIVFVLDVCFEKMNALGVNSLKSIVQSTTNNEEAYENTEAEQTENSETDNEENLLEDNNIENDLEQTEEPTENAE